MSEERWLPIHGWESLYEVSDHGRVRSLDRVVLKSDGRIARYRGRMMTPNMGPAGYPRVGLSDSQNDRMIVAMVHQLVAEVFIPNLEGLPHVLHWDDVKTNNVWTNLRWGSHSDNMQDIVRNGNHHHAVKTHCPQGHEYTAENTYVTPGRPTARYCRTCQAEHKRRYRESMRAIAGVAA